MGTSLSCTYVRTGGEPMATAIEVLSARGFEVADAVDASVRTRRLRVWRHGEWVVLEDEDTYEPGDLGVFASRHGDTLTVDCFNSDVALVSRFTSGEHVGMLLVGRSRPPGSGRLNGEAIEAFRDLLLPGTEIGDLRDLTKRTSNTAERVSDDLLGLFGLEFDREPTAYEVLTVTDGEVIEAARAPRLHADVSMFPHALEGVAGDRAGTVVGIAGFENDGPPVDRVQLELTGSALERGLIAIDTVMYVVTGTEYPAPSFIDSAGPRYSLDLRQFAPSGSDESEAASVGRLPQRIAIGFEGWFGAIGDGDLVVTVAAKQTAAASWRVAVSSIEPNVAPIRRAPFPDRSGSRSRAIQMLAGTEIVLSTLHLEPECDMAWCVELMVGWVGLVSAVGATAVALSDVEGVRSLPVSQVGGRGQRWSRVSDHIAAGKDLLVVAEVDGEEHHLDIRRPGDRASGDVDRVQVSVPNGDDAFSWACDMVGAASAQRLIWQAHVGRYGRGEKWPRLHRIYEVAVGHHPHLQLDSRRYLAEPSRLVLVEHALAEQLNDADVDALYERDEVGGLVRLVAADWPALHEMEHVFAPILRPSPVEQDLLPGLARSFRWDRPVPA